MFKSYWTIAWRTLVRHKLYTLVNVLGLALGICACLMIWVIVHFDFGFDGRHPAGSRIYRVNSYEQFLKNEPRRMSPSVLTEVAVTNQQISVPLLVAVTEGVEPS